MGLARHNTLYIKNCDKFVYCGKVWLIILFSKVHCHAFTSGVSMVSYLYRVKDHCVHIMKKLN